MRQYVESIRLYLNALHAAAGSRGDLRKMIEQKLPHLLLIGRHRVNIYKRACELKQVHNKSARGFSGDALSCQETARRGLIHFPIALHPARKNQVE